VAYVQCPRTATKRIKEIYYILLAIALKDIFHKLTPLGKHWRNIPTGTI
jgi:hypothetical protein